MSEETIWDDPNLDAAARALRRLLEAKAADRGAELKTLMIMAITDEGQVSMNFEGCTCVRCAGAILTHIAEEVFHARTEVSEEIVEDDAECRPRIH